MATLWVERVLVPRVAHYLLHRYLRGVHGRVELANVPTLDDQQGTLPQCVMWRLRLTMCLLLPALKRLRLLVRDIHMMGVNLRYLDQIRQVP